MRRLIVVGAAAAALVISVTPAGAVNDPFAPGDECSASGTAIGHPAFVHEQSDKASPPFSFNNPGKSTGAKGTANSQAAAHCTNAQPAD